MKDKQGNAKEPEQVEEIKPGDYVRLTDAALKHGPRMMGPLKLYSVGWPNLFQVVHKFEENGVQYLSIGCCCKNLLLNRKNNARLCSGHDQKWFRKMSIGTTEEQEPEREPRKGDRLTSIELPVLGEAAALEFLDNEQNPLLVMRVLGQKVVLNGQTAVDIAKFAQANGLL